MKFEDAVSAAVKKFSSPEFIKNIKEEDESMLRHLNILKRINSLGYITEQSQAGRKHKGLSYNDGKPFVSEERAFICGFMLESMASQFIKNMALHTDKNAIFIPSCEDNIYIPARFDIPLTIETVDGKTEIHTHMSSVLPHSVWEQYRKGLHINKNEKIALIFCWDSKWNRDASSQLGLFSDVEKILKMSK